MSRQDRLKEYAKPLRPENWQGAGRDAQNISRWSARATENSQLAPRSEGLDVRVVMPGTGKVKNRDTLMQPREARNADRDMVDVAKEDKNFVGDSNYMKGVRRTT